MDENTGDEHDDTGSHHSGHSSVDIEYVARELTTLEDDHLTSVETTGAGRKDRDAITDSEDSDDGIARPVHGPLPPLNERTPAEKKLALARWMQDVKPYLLKKGLSLDAGGATTRSQFSRERALQKIVAAVSPRGRARPEGFLLGPRGLPYVTFSKKDRSELTGWRWQPIKEKIAFQPQTVARFLHFNTLTEHAAAFGEMNIRTGEDLVRLAIKFRRHRWVRDCVRLILGLEAGKEEWQGVINVLWSFARLPKDTAREPPA